MYIDYKLHYGPPKAIATKASLMASIKVNRKGEI